MSMGFDMMSLQALVEGAGHDPAVQELFGGPEQLRKLQERRKIEGDARLRLAQAILNVFDSPDGQVLFEYLARSYLTRFDDVTALGLPMETAIQIYAGRNAEQQLVKDLFRMIKEARNPTSKAAQGA